jgi:cytochrome c peroxidase
MEGKARICEAEMRGLRLFNDPEKANCAGCHTAEPTKEGYPPHFTDFQYEALGVPRNVALADPKNPNYFDLGVCGQIRKDRCRPDAILRHVQDADLAQHRGAPRVLPQWRIQLSKVKDGSLAD